MSRLKLSLPEAEEEEDAERAVAALVPPGVREMSLDDALQLAVQLHRLDRLESAITMYQRILQIVPDHADALCLLGMAEHQAGRSEHGLKLIRRAIEQVPGFSGFHVNLGNVLVEMNRLSEALSAYGRACELAPEAADSLNNMGAVYRAVGRVEEAEDCYRRALALDGRHVRAWNNLGLLLDARGDLEGAMQAYLTAIDMVPEQGLSAYLLGMTYYRAGLFAKATEVFRQWALREPDNPVAAHLYAAGSGQNVPQRASEDYIEAEFDGFAANFERVLNERLHYRAPQICADLLVELLGPPQASLELLDAGCGTGLCGALVAPWARRMVGVDLSAGMLAKARTKGVYHALVKSELTAYLLQGSAAWDAIVCADVLVYFGDLSGVMQAAASALRPGALMVFTVEALPDDGDAGVRILPNGRYAHGRSHLDQVLASAGLQTLCARREILRDESGKPVQGWLMAVQRPA